MNSHDYLIYYAEDEFITRRMITTLLRKHFTVEDFANGLTALEACEQKLPDCLITDLSMPSLNGFELIASIRKISQTLPIVITSAYREDAQKLKDSVSAILIKPTNYKVLIQTVSDVLEKP